MTIYFSEKPPWKFQIFRFTSRNSREKSFYPWKFWKFVWHPLEIPKSKTKTHSNSALVFLECHWNFHFFLNWPLEFPCFFFVFCFFQDSRKFHVLNPPAWIFSGIAQSPLLLCKVHHFADDTNLLFLTNSIKNLNKPINIDLKNLPNWLNANKIPLNIKKNWNYYL